ncbi:MAG: TraR/DksA family transcriptional regulator [Candidatus Omnitrophica bacterium]|nr:TraR/DksA family transcriptional regulator [Candidatus Omnitrophota bacterium]MDD5352779.1 TraR/DksA family transcriptional regulator [Candidatus Omnitrophota bacterium]MDD5550378.1 TraR/DksA family transcriptional regulator [Candidatus Omnitrophota bacterium]
MKKNKFDKKTVAEFKKLLIKRKEEANEEINHISSDTLKQSQKEASGDISGYSLHMADVATDNYDREFSLGLAGNERDILIAIDAALNKIKDGSFGLCEECNKPISKTRLKAVPYAKLCIKCQESREKTV